MEVDAGKAQDLHDFVVGAACPLKEFVGDTGDEWQGQKAQAYSHPHVGPAHEHVDDDGDDHYEHQERSSAARVQCVESLSVFGGELQAVFEAVDGFVLCPVVLEDLVDVLELGDDGDVADEDTDPHQTLDEVQDDDAVGEFFEDADHGSGQQHEDADTEDQRDDHREPEQNIPGPVFTYLLLDPFVELVLLVLLGEILFQNVS